MSLYPAPPLLTFDLTVGDLVAVLGEQGVVEVRVVVGGGVVVGVLVLELGGGRGHAGFVPSR